MCVPTWKVVKRGEKFACAVVVVVVHFLINRTLIRQTERQTERIDIPQSASKHSAGAGDGARDDDDNSATLQLGSFTLHFFSTSLFFCLSGD